ncbi:hypothetical protein HDU89_003917 [Geranomyces variabilis]|nr:hypothetical protein HDU89_003917 [Geranomyces variabilis]
MFGSRRTSTVAASEMEWLKLLDHWDSKAPKSRKKIKKMGRAGIPESLRGKVWSALARTDDIKKPGVYDGLLAQRNEEVFDIIERDIARCFPEHPMFAEEGGPGQTNLRNVLRAYAMYNPDIGYCQGMGMLAGMMLMHMPAEESFWLLVATLQTILKDFYTPQLLQLRRDAAVFESLLYKTSKRVARHLDKQEVTPLMYMTSWFMTVFTTTLPWESALRVWDMVYCEGVKPLFRTSLAIFDIFKTELLKECPTNAEILSLLLHLPQEPLEPELLIKRSLRVKVKNKAITNLRNNIAGKVIGDRGTISLVKRK